MQPVKSCGVTNMQKHTGIHQTGSQFKKNNNNNKILYNQNVISPILEELSSWLTSSFVKILNKRLIIKLLSGKKSFGATDPVTRCNQHAQTYRNKPNQINNQTRSHSNDSRRHHSILKVARCHGVQPPQNNLIFTYQYYYHFYLKLYLKTFNNTLVNAFMYIAL